MGDKMKLTYGEAIFLKRQNLDFTQPIYRMAQSLNTKIPPRMNRSKATEYYKAKLQKVWESVA
jgi:hypothetical protein